ncbi:HEAT repeat domain-containing protein [Gimesia sp.]|uniref:HEAT repeat domain-containing protein n=1 Tax=Gimesia sp. TaxID=2024833 RepID=UPI003A8EB765
MLQNVRETPLAASLKEKVTRKVPKDLEGLQVYLSHDLWVRNHNWSPEQEWNTFQKNKTESQLAPLEVQRWVFGSVDQKTLLSEIGGQQPETNPEQTAAESESTSEQPVPEQTAKSDSKASDKQQKPESWSFNAFQDFFSDQKKHRSKLSENQRSDKLVALQELSTWDNLAGWNAAILWATISPATAIEALPVLEKVALDQTNASPNKSGNDPGKPDQRAVSEAMQHAALNAISLVLSQADAIPLETRTKLSQRLQRPDLSVEQRSELYLTLARFMSPASIPSLDRSLEISEQSTIAPKQLRRAALQACILHGHWFHSEQGQPDHPEGIQTFNPEEWPANIMQVRWDTDAEMRWNFGYWAALIHHSDAETILISQLRDADRTVQIKAIEHLGMMRSETALQVLKEYAARPAENLRVAAAKGLSSWGPMHLIPLKNDTSSAVRLEVAWGLGKTPTAESALHLRSLINDRSSQVQSTVIQAISDWPDDLAVPLLLDGIQEGIYKTRRQSILQLVDRTGLGGSISIEASHQERVAAVNDLVQSGRLPGSFWGQLMQQGLKTNQEVNQGRTAELQSYFQTLINQPRESAEYQQAYQELANISPAEVKVLEKLIRETSIEIPGEIYTDLLADLSPEYAALNQLTSPHINDRREAAQQLFVSSQNISLNPVVVARLRKLMAHEQDRLVWRIVMSSVEKDNYEEAAQLALLAINHNWPDIRILGCEYFGSHGLPQYAIWLLPLLDDKNHSVQLAAIQAIGQCHNPIAISGTQKPGESQNSATSLRSLMTHSNRRVRFETVVALSRLGDFAGMQELLRLSNDTHISTRKEAVREMGNSGQTRFVEPLIQMAWTERNNTTLKEILSSLDKLVPESERPASLNPQLDQSDRAKIWMNWWQSQHSGQGSRLFTGR